MKVGYIGLGALGGSLARCFLRGRALTVWDLNADAVAALVSEGATAAGTAADLARACDVIFTCLPRSSDVRRLVFGPGGLAEGLGAGKLVVDQTSGVPAETADIASKLAGLGCDMMDAAVSASPQVAIKGDASLMVSGPDAVYERALPLLGEIARSVFRCGSRVGDGQAMKMVNNAMNGAIRLGTLEIVAMGRKKGLPLGTMSDVLNGGTGANLTTERMLPAIAEGRESTNFALALMLKDVNQAVSLGLAVGAPMPIIGAARSLFQVGVNTLGEGARLEQVITLTETLSATTFTGGRDGPAAEDADAVAAVVNAAVTALCTAVTYEGVSAGLRYGLALSDMADVFVKSSGWSRASRDLLPALVAGRRGAGRPAGEMAADLAAAARFGMEVGAPMLLLDAARCVFESCRNRIGNASEMSHYYEEIGGVSFQPA